MIVPIMVVRTLQATSSILQDPNPTYIKGKRRVKYEAVIMTRMTKSVSCKHRYIQTDMMSLYVALRIQIREIGSNNVLVNRILTSYKSPYLQLGGMSKKVALSKYDKLRQHLSTKCKVFFLGGGT